MTVHLRQTADTLTALLRWMRGAQHGDWCVYHIGNLARDRSQSAELNQMAETVLLLAETGHLAASSYRVNLPMVAGWTYYCTRTAQSHPPRAILTGDLSAIEYRALAAVRDRDADTSATRAVRNAVSAALGNSDRIANAILDQLKARALVTPAEGKGWELSQEGRSALL